MRIRCGLQATPPRAQLAMIDVVAESSAEGGIRRRDLLPGLAGLSPFRRCAHWGQAELLRLPFLGGA
jgi:hypothetical protein